MSMMDELFCDDVSIAQIIRIVKWYESRVR